MRTDFRRTMLVQADLEPGMQINTVLERLKTELPNIDIDPGVSLRFKGGAQDQAETAA
jgi:multidrug efflux pump